jgi:peptidoglycan biosynthesis protein MviN/MurJ (putative lipid II flippase)
LLAGNNAPEVALIFGFLTVAILFRTVYAIVSRYFYAQKNTKIPLLVSLVAIGLNIFLAYNLSKPTSYGVSGLAIAQSIVAATEVAILSTVMVIHDPKLLSWKFLGGMLKIFSITGFSIVVAYTMVTLFPLRAADLGVGIAIKLVLISVVTIASHVCLSWLFDLEESRPIVKKVRQIVLRPVKIQ